MSRRAACAGAVCILCCTALLLLWAGTERRPSVPLAYSPATTQAESPTSPLTLSPVQSVAVEQDGTARVSLEQQEESVGPPVLDLPLYEVAGIVQDDAGMAVPGCEVVLRTSDGGGRVFADTAGGFRFEPVSSKVVELFVANSASRKVISTLETHRVARPERPGWGATRVDLSSNEGESITIPLLRASFLEGRVVDANLSPLEKFLVHSEHEMGRTGAVSGQGRTGESGRFSLRVLPGSSSLFLEGRLGAGAGEKASLALRELLLVPGERRNLGDLQPVVNRAVLSIKGSLVDEGEIGLRGVQLSLVDSEGAIHGIRTTRYRGRFSFEDLQPGDYQIVLTERPSDPWRQSVKLTHKTSPVDLGPLTLRLQ